VTTGQTVIVCLTALIALAILAAAAYAVARDASTTRVVIESKRSDAARDAVSEQLTTATDALRKATAVIYTHIERGGRPGPKVVGRSLVVHTRKPDDQSIRGIVAAHYADRLVFRDAQYLHASGAQAAAGLVEVPLINVSSWQELEPPEVA
jgi:hypothetical protein